ncbi:MAG: gamma-glutamyl-gamma-aminobutyrate hydrolase family protein [Bdellovibrionales bacterium]|nr:gamma-glutamyl-gamma-aminobutyrate hydrolase family protein [Bdellovibrionales bacterium]
MPTHAPVIGVSSCLMHADTTNRKNIFNGKPLLYAEQSMMHYLLGAGAIPFLIPTRPTASAGYPKVPSVQDILGQVQGVVIVGGVDMSPGNYGEAPLKPEWSGDPIRDAYEMELIRTALGMDKPVLGICRGYQVLNVTLGGSLYQDINTQVKGSLVHRDATIYDQNFHDLEIVPGSDFERLYRADKRRRINSVHHQAIKDLGQGLVVEARCPVDGIIEAVRLEHFGGAGAWARGVQWHPEFMVGFDESLMSPWPIVEDFLQAVNDRRKPKASTP